MKCKKKMPSAKNGNERGLCSKEKGHPHWCTNNTCYMCGARVKRVRGGWCPDCYREYNGSRARVPQLPHKLYTFRCGCSGVLPAMNQPNKFAYPHSKGRWGCRIGQIIGRSVRAGKQFGYKPINVGYLGHALISRMMEEKNCVLCHEPMQWEFGFGKTPHLHHDHQTGRPIGFSHSRCNPLDLQRRVVQLEAEVQFLKAA